MNNKKTDLLIGLLQKEVKPALGCTEPIAVALASAKAAELLNTRPEKIDIFASGNIIKNGMGVGIPGTDTVGLHIAAALGAIGGDANAELEVLKNISAGTVEQAKKLVFKDFVTIHKKETPEKLYIEAAAVSGEHKASVIIAGHHTNFIFMAADNNIILDNTSELQKFTEDHDEVLTTVEEIFEFAAGCDLEKIRPAVQFIFDGAALNDAIADEGLKGNYGLQVGKTVVHCIDKDIVKQDITTYAMSRAAAASDARMAGSMMPVMSNSGSGNQGITVSVPITAVARKLGASTEKTERALLMGNLIAIHLKTFMDRLSAFCGAVSAATGASAGVVYLMDGDANCVKHTIKNMIGNIAGMICDGAKAGCALKVSTSVSAAMQSAILAVHNLYVTEYEGIIEKDIEKTIKNLALIASQGMAETDKLILDIMTCK